MEETKEKKSVYQKWWFWVILVLVCVSVGYAAIFGGDSEVPGPSVDVQSKEEIVQVSADELLEAYQANTVAADGKYGDKKLKITGTVTSIGKDIADRAYIVLNNEYDKYAIAGVQCFFDSAQEDSLASLKEGDKVTVIGTCDDYLINVSVKNCELAE